MDKQEYDDFVARLKDDGYFSFSQQVDKDVCSENPCAECGTPSTRYEGWQKNTGDEASYRAFSICDKCGDVAEF